MGGGKGGGGCQVTGHAYYLGIAYAFCGHSEEMLGFKRNGTTEWSGSVIGGQSFRAVSGKRPDPVPNNYNYLSESCDIKYYDGSQTSADSLMASATGHSINYGNTTYMTMSNGNTGAYIGVNVTTVPPYKAKLRRTTFHAVLGTSRIGDDVNPAHIIYDILVTHLELSTGLIDIVSFTDAATLLATEGIGLSFLMTKEKTASVWIDEILRHIDGMLYYDRVSKKYTLLLLRDDYDINTVDKITESNTLDLTFERKSWADTFNTVTFKYTDIEAKSLTSFVLINTANKKTVGQVKAKTVEYPMVTDFNTLELIANRAMKKLSYPLAAIKFSVSTIDFPNMNVGDVVNLTHSFFGVADIPIRILSIGGDKEDSTIIEVEGTEDIYGINKSTTITSQGNLAVAVDWSVGTMVSAQVLDVPPELYTSGQVIPMGVAPTGLVTYTLASETGTTNSTQTSVFMLGALTTTMASDDYIIDNTTISNVSGITENTPLSDAEWQSGVNLLVIGNEVIIFRDIVANGPNFDITGIIRGTLGTTLSTHAISDNVWIATGDIATLVLENTAYDITISGANPNTIGTGLQVNGTYGYTGDTPYPPANLSASRNVNDITISWNPTVRQHGATYYVATNITAGLDEGLSEGSWKVSWDTGEQLVTSPTITRTEAGGKTYTITTLLNGRESSSKTIII